jgi:uracil-DNA glycosylase family 4
MNSELISLRLTIQECTACSFWNPAITPLAPSLVESPISVMFIGENPSWAEEQTEPFASNTISGGALEKYYLMPLGLTRSQVWITDLF